MNTTSPKVAMCFAIVLGLAVTGSAALGDPWDAPSRQVWGSETSLVSVDQEGVVDEGSRGNAISADGRYIAFASAARWDPDDNHGVDIYLRDMVEQTTALISRGLAGTDSDGYSDSPSISADGRFVAFYSSATDLVASAKSHPEGQYDVYRHDALTGATELVSAPLSGTWGDSDSVSPAISASGQLVAFESGATNLVQGDTNVRRDIFVRDLHANATERVSVSYTGEQLLNRSVQPSISADGARVAFVSNDSKVVRSDSDRRRDVFVRDTTSGTNFAVSITSQEEEVVRASYGPAISGNGRCVGFESEAPGLTERNRLDLVDIFVRNLTEGTTRLASRSSSGASANDNSHEATMAQSCRLVVFASGASNLVPLMTHEYAGHVYIRNLVRRTTRWVSAPYDPTLSSKLYAYGAHVSADGSAVAFDSSWRQLVPGDVDQQMDVFVRLR